MLRPLVQRKVSLEMASRLGIGSKDTKRPREPQGAVCDDAHQWLKYRCLNS